MVLSRGDCMEKWWKESTVYQIYPKSFCDSDGDGIGDIKGITEKLDYINKLGCDVIWLCPVYKSPMKDNGYDVSDYYSIDPVFGTNDDLFELIEKAGKKGIKIIMDLVVNHCSSEHKWFKEFLKNPHSKYRDYFIVKESKTVPNNWRSVFGGSVWEKIKGTDLYYYHTFAKEQPDLNWECKALREEVYEMINWWLEKGIAGFRVDAITHIKKDLAFKDKVPDGADNLASPHMENYNGIDKFLNELKARCFENCMTVAEAPGVTGEALKEYIGDNGYFSMIFDFSYADMDVASHGNWYQKRNFTKKEFRDEVFKTHLNLSKYGWGANYLENHDQPRSPNKYLDVINYHSVTALGVFWFFLRGTPFIYQGQELGSVNTHWNSIDEFDDLQTKDQYKRALSSGMSEREAFETVSARSRDNSRTPFLWDNSKNHGFTEGISWLKFNENSKSIVDNPVLNFYKEMISLRKREKEVLIHGDFEPRLTEYDEIFCYEREKDNKKITVICNFSDSEKNLPLDIKEILLNNYEEYEENILKPFQAIVYR